jgi:hypothetical protein
VRVDGAEGKIMQPTTVLDVTERPSLWERRVESRPDASERKRRANEFMRSGLEKYDPSEPIPFFCECRREGCYQPVWLTKAEYDRRRSRPDRVLFAGDHDAAEMSLLVVTGGSRDA